jgi:hypothetical protein
LDQNKLLKAAKKEIADGSYVGKAPNMTELPFPVDVMRGNPHENCVPIPVFQ